MSINPYWFIVAKSFEGEFHAKGGNPHPALKELVHLVDDFSHLSDENWGAAFVGGCLALSGFHSSHSLNPASYAYFGRKITTPIKGCVVLFNAMPEPHKAGHVAFFESIEGDKISVLGGNEPLSVGTHTFPLNKVKGYFYPNAVSLLPDPRPQHLTTIDSITDDVPPHLHDELIDNTQIAFSQPITYNGEYGGKDLENKELCALISAEGLPKPIADTVYGAAQKLGAHRAGLLLQQALTHQGFNLLQDGNINQYTLLACQRVNVERLQNDFEAAKFSQYDAILNPKKSEPIMPESILPVITTPVAAPTNVVMSQADLQAIIANAVSTNKLVPVETHTHTSAIDKLMGGEIFKGKKTMFAVVAYIFNELLVHWGAYPNTSDIYIVINWLAAGLFTIGLLSKLDRFIERP